MSSQVEAVACCSSCEVPTEIQPQSWTRLGISGLFAFAAVAAGLTNATPLAIALALGSMVVGGRETLRNGLHSVRARRIDISLLMTIAVTGAIILGEWPEAAMVTFLFALAERIEQLSVDRANRTLGGLMEMAPDEATVRTVTGDWQRVQTASVKVGQRIRVAPGARIPLDGAVASGTSQVNQAPITGESMPVLKSNGDTVFAGTVNGSGSLEITVTAGRADTTLAHIIDTVARAQADKAPIERFVDQFARRYTPAVAGVALLVAVIPPLVTGAPVRPWLYNALVLLVIACPCALVISTPVTVVSGLTAAARAGILVKGGRFLEAGRHLRAIAFDKTGTLTRGLPVLTDVVPLPTVGSALDAHPGAPSQNEILRLAASLEVHSEHPVASAVVRGWSAVVRDAARQLGAGPVSRPYKSAHLSDAEGQLSTGVDGTEELAPPSHQLMGELLPVTDVTDRPGEGIEGRLAGQSVALLSHRAAAEAVELGSRTLEVLQQLESEGKSTSILVRGGEAVAVLAVADELRDESRSAVAALRKEGILTTMLTGDGEARAAAIAAELALDEFSSDMLPEDKLAHVESLLATYETVGVVGDGINDAPALARATIGFAMGAAGSDTALETADVALMDDDLSKLPAFVHLSRRTSRVLSQNIALAIGTKLAVFVLALFGFATLWLAVLADLGTSLVVVFNGLRLLREQPPAGATAQTGSDAPARRVKQSPTYAG